MKELLKGEVGSRRWRGGEEERSGVERNRRKGGGVSDEKKVELKMESEFHYNNRIPLCLERFQAFKTPFMLKRVWCSNKQGLMAQEFKS